MDWNEYSRWFKWHFQQEIKDFVSFIIHELDIDYQARVLELGSGAGWVSLELARRMPDTQIVGLEPNPELVTIANQNKAQEKSDNVSFVKHHYENLKLFANQSFDCVISFKGLKQWTFPLKTFNEIDRILTKDGVYALTDYRKDKKWLAKASFWITGKTMPKKYRNDWKALISQSYSLEEILKILMLTRLKDWKIRTTLFDILICKMPAKIET